MTEELIRSNSNPSEDVETAVKSNANFLDALYRLSFTADRLSEDEFDYLMSQIKKRADEVEVLIRRVVKRHVPVQSS